MLKTIHFYRIFILLIAVLSTGITYAQDKSLYYYYNKEKVYLEQQADKIAVMFNPKVDLKLQQELLKDPILKSNSIPTEGGLPGIYVLDIVEGTSITAFQNLFNRIRENENVLSASPFYSTIYGGNGSSSR